uniref:NADH dehydrogenase [ubiquinone] 1 alpha subcomplex subunit n=1 Tax=Blastobotrys adeninivorans TaxID=409370 RepID=A0A060T317_BLAAD
MSTSIIRQVRNAYKSGWKLFAVNMGGLGDAKYGRLVGTDVYGNKYYENTEDDEIHLRTRWVVNKDHYFDLSQVEPGWHYWLSYGVDVPPPQTAPENLSKPAAPGPVNYTNMTGTPGAYVCYNTTRPKFSPWQPKVAQRG